MHYKDLNNIVFFDGVCSLCNGVVDFLIKKDVKGTLYYASLQTNQSIQFLEQLEYNAKELDTIVFYKDGKLYKKSTAVLYIIKQQGIPWSLFFIFIIVPPFIRDLIYKIIAQNRYQWFGKKETCRLPTPEEKSRFLWS